MRVLCKSFPQYFSIVVILSFAGIMLASSLIRIPIPFSPVPITMQTLVLFAGIVLFNKKASLAQLSFLLLGSGTGLLLLTGPTAGYLWGFLSIFNSPTGNAKNQKFRNSFVCICYG